MFDVVTEWLNIDTWYSIKGAWLQFEFLRPWWLLLLPISMGLTFLLSRLDNHSAWEQFIDPVLLRPLLQPQQQTGFVTPVRLASVLLVFWVLALSGPSWRDAPSPFADDKAPLVIALGLTESMLADDLLPSRLERAKMKISHLLEARRGSPTALIAYADSAHVVLPLTEDSDILSLYLNELAPNVMPTAGLNIERALQRAGELLTDAGFTQGGGSVVLIGDQVDSQSINPLNSNVAVSLLLVGPSGATAEDQLQISANNEFVDVAAVQSFTQQQGINLIRMSADESDMTQLQRRIVRNFETRLQADQQAQREDAGYYLLFPIALLMLLWFRRGMVLQWY